MPDTGSDSRITHYIARIRSDMEYIVFVVTAIIAAVGAVAMVLSKNAVHSALFLLLNFGAISVLYLLLRAPFLFVVQLIVYAGAIIVLFLFVVMLLGAERVEDTPDSIAWQRPLAIGLGILLLIEALYVAFSRTVGAVTPVAQRNEDFASPERIGQALFSTYLLPFEITSVVLLAAIVGVVVLSKRSGRVEQAQRALEHDADGRSEQMEQVMERVG
jgi:NADH-quinone oxidoreductase subunit J